MKAFVIGDPHFKHTTDASEMETYVKKIIGIARKHDPHFIVVLGDILNDHEVVRVQPHKLAEKLLEGLSDIAHTYVLMGNHDYINNSQFLTDNHIFGPFKKWQNLTIVDKTIDVVFESQDRYFVFVPYVPPGKFGEALDTLIKEGGTWELADCIFAHQEFKGCKPRMKDNIFKSKTGDVWSEDYPLVVSGHIHKSQDVGNNIKYPGNSFQHSHKESCNKYVWIMEWAEGVDEPYITKINTGLKKKKILTLSIDEIKEKGEDIIKEQSKFDLRINLIGSSAEFNNFRTTKMYNTFANNGTTFTYELKVNSTERNSEQSDNYVDGVPISSGTTRSDISYDRVFQDLVLCKSDKIKREYEKLFGPLTTSHKDFIEIEIVTDSEEEYIEI